MSRNVGKEIAPGDVFEFYDAKEVLCGVVLAVKDGRLNAISETNREVAVALSRIIFRGKTSLNLALGRDELVQRLRSPSPRAEKTSRRRSTSGISGPCSKSEENGYGRRRNSRVPFHHSRFRRPGGGGQKSASERQTLFPGQRRELLSPAGGNCRGSPCGTPKGRE